MLVTDQGKVIRIPVDGIRIAGRNTQGVTLFHTDKNEHVVSVARLEGASNIENDDEDGEDEETTAANDEGEALADDDPTDSS
jgi:DNA gyrase subunit A